MSSEPRTVDAIVQALYAEGRSARRQQALIRAQWFADLPVPGKADALFELETLLEGIVHLPRVRLAGAGRRGSSPGDGDRSAEMERVVVALQRAGGRAGHLLRQPRRRRMSGTGEVAGDPEQLLALPRSNALPEEALRALSHAIEGFAHIAKALAQGGATTRTFHAVVGAVAREVAHTTHFSPLNPVEVREEVDPLPAGARAALERVGSDAGRRVAARAFLLLGRCERMLALGQRLAEEGVATTVGPVVIAAFQHRARGMAAYFEDRAGDALAEGFEQELLSVPVGTLKRVAPELEAQARALVRLRAALEGAAVALRLETRPRSDDVVAELPRLRAAVDAVETRLERTLLGDSAGRLGKESAALRDERLRRDTWMFAHVLRAFLAKAEAFAGDADSWAAAASQRFVGDFLQHFRALGQPLVGETDYPAAGSLRGALETLRETDLLDAERMAHAAKACAEFRDHLRRVFDGLADTPFDRAEAAETLKAYLAA